MTRELLTLTASDSTGSAPDDAFGVEEIAERAGLEPSVVEAVVEAVRELDYETHPWRDPERLRRLYYREGLSQQEAAHRLGCGPKAVQRWMEFHGLNPGGNPVTGVGRKLQGMDPDELTAG